MVSNNNGYEYNFDGFFIGANTVLYHDGLSDKAKMLYFHMSNRYNFFLWANQVQKSGKITDVNEVYCESQAKMATAIGYAEGSRSKVTNLIQQLEDAGLLRVLKKNDGKNSNWYIPLTINGEANITVNVEEGNIMVSKRPIIQERSVRLEPRNTESNTNAQGNTVAEVVGMSTELVEPIEDDEDDDYCPFSDTTPINDKGLEDVSSRTNVNLSSGFNTASSGSSIDRVTPISKKVELPPWEEEEDDELWRTNF